MKGLSRISRSGPDAPAGLEGNEHEITGLLHRLDRWTRRVAAIVAVLAEKKLVAEEDRHDLIRDALNISTYHFPPAVN